MRETLSLGNKVEEAHRRIANAMCTGRHAHAHTCEYLLTCTYITHATHKEKSLLSKNFMVPKAKLRTKENENTSNYKMGITLTERLDFKARPLVLASTGRGST